MIKQTTIDGIKDKISIEDVIRDFVVLRKRGANWIGLCPFHMEKTASFSVSPTRQRYKCFGCGESGDVIDFIKNYQGLEFIEAVKVLCDQHNIDIELSEDRFKREYEVLSQWNKTFMESFQRNESAKDYIRARGITDEEVKKFEIGFCPFAVPDDAILFNYDDPRELKSLGMLSNSNKLLFCMRITFPIKNKSGKVTGFAGRRLSPNMGGPKYINSGTSRLYQKDRSLYGLKMARRISAHRDEMNVVEGYTDVIAMHRQGFENSVACCGTAFTEGHADLIKTICSKVVFWFDGDEAGQRAARRSIEIALKKELGVEVRKLPPGEDVFSIDQKGGNLKDIPVLSISELFKPSNGKISSHDQANAINKALEVIKSIVDPIQRDLELRQLSRTFGVGYNILHRRLHVALQANNLNYNNYEGLRRPNHLGRSGGFKSRNSGLL